MLNMQQKTQLIILNSVLFWSSQSLPEQSKCTYLHNNMYRMTGTFIAQISVLYTAATYAQLLDSFFRSFTEQRVAVDSDSAVPEFLIWTTCNQCTWTCASTVVLEDFTEHTHNAAEQWTCIQWYHLCRHTHTVNTASLCSIASTYIPSPIWPIMCFVGR